MNNEESNARGILYKLELGILGKRLLNLYNILLFTKLVNLFNSLYLL